MPETRLLIKCEDCVHDIKNEMAKRDDSWLTGYFWKVHCKVLGEIWREPHEAQPCERGKLNKNDSIVP